MKKELKITLGVIGGIILLFAIDLICIFTINRPLFAVKKDNVYRGLLYDTYLCSEYTVPQIKQKRAKFTCAVLELDIGEVVELADETKNIKDFACAEALEGFYEDEHYTYYWSCIKNEYMVVKYDDGSKELISEALKNKHIEIGVLDKFDIDYYKEEKGITLENVNTIIQEYFGNEKVDRTNLGYNYIDEEKRAVVVGLIDNSKEKQDEFIHNVFSNCCGSMYIEYVKDNSMIEFRKTDKITTSNN